ncbi:HdeD family acid-resistance protein [Leucobacter denitrificans]|uniref:DUF308 domain-containing protein n=1 Tax=Leucobacter denitrificans TaxID=683042 RepID=A0A7G9S3R3_9MICO|nr:DUF308 domain-containing protein [Leucobacter denitrificans]QNN62488.1 DUF308 domain-containing protein [Leucobacter denitrificans]
MSATRLANAISREEMRMTWELIPDASGPQNTPGNGSGSPKRSASPRWVMLLIGIVVALLGAALVVWPFFAASRIVAILVGAALIANGVAAIVGTPVRALGAPAGVLLIVLGLFALAFPEFTVSMLVGFVAFLMLLFGGIWLLIAIRLRTRIRPLFIVLPALVVALGLVALFFPAVALTVAALAAGVVTLLIGGSIVWGALALRRGTLPRD